MSCKNNVWPTAGGIHNITGRPEGIRGRLSVKIWNFLGGWVLQEIPSVVGYIWMFHLEVQKAIFLVTSCKITAVAV